MKKLIVIIILCVVKESFQKHFTIIKGKKLPTEYVDFVSTAVVRLECAFTCKQSDCQTFSFSESSNSNNCLMSKLKKINLVLKTDITFSTGTHEAPTDVKTPTIFLPLDKKGTTKNYGKGGPDFDATTVNTTWSNTRPNSGVQVMHLNKTSQSYAFITNLNSLSLNQTSFTLGLWLKSDSETYSMITEFGVLKAHFWFYPDSRQLYLGLPGCDKAYASSLVTSKGDWYHVAFAYYHSTLSGQIFINGDAIESTEGQQGGGNTGSLIVDDTLNIGGYTDLRLNAFFTGDMACYFLIDEALTSEELKKVISSCPE